MDQNPWPFFLGADRQGRVLRAEALGNLARGVIFQKEPPAFRFVTCDPKTKKRRQRRLADAFRKLGFQVTFTPLTAAKAQA